MLGNAFRLCRHDDRGPRLWPACLLLLLLAPLAVGQENATLVVTCNQPELVKAYDVRVLRLDPRLKVLRPTDHRAPFDYTGRAELNLPPGVYAVETLHLTHDHVLVALRSDRFTFPRRDEVALRALPPQPVTLTHAGSPVTIHQFAARSAAVTGEVRWTREDPAATPSVALSPGERYRLNVVGATGATHVAGWFKHRAGDEPVFRTASSWRQMRFAWRPGTPPVTEATVDIHFPDTQLHIPVADDACLLTNRVFALIGYRVTLETGQRLVFHGHGAEIQRNHRFEMGGELVPQAWAAYVWQQESSGWTPHFVWRAGLANADDHIVNVYDQAAGVSSSIHRVDGKEVPSDRVDDATREQLGDLTQSLRVRLNWTWNGPQSREIAPRGYEDIRSDHFRIESVPLWPWQSRNYLTKLERARLILREITQRPGPRTFNIDWRHNTHNARASIGGEDWVWCSLPFRGYEENHDPFSHPWFMIHEMLHNFGYHHGDEMGRLQNEGQFLFEVYRWHLIDNPGLTVPIEPGRPYVDPATRRRR
jgi:hypothetical protein